MTTQLVRAQPCWADMDIIALAPGMFSFRKEYGYLWRWSWAGGQPEVIFPYNAVQQLATESQDFLRDFRMKLGWLHMQYQSQ